MSFTITELRVDIKARLAAAIDGATWTDAILDAGLRQALEQVSIRGPAVEADCAAAAGREQDLSALAGLFMVEAVAWPWDAEARLAERAVRWRYVEAPERIRLERASPAAGDTLRVRYRRSHSIDGLDGATTTSIPDVWRGMVAAGAAAYAARLRTRQLSEQPALPLDAGSVLRRWSDRGEEEFLAQIDATLRVPGPVWGGVGL